jgi:hypothetical protein
MTKDQYLMMCEQTGEEVDWDKCPPDWEDFPNIISDILSIFNSMGNRVYPDIGYIGKDYANFDFLLKYYQVEDYQIEFVFNTILWLDSRAIKESQQRMKREMDRMKSK